MCYNKIYWSSFPNKLDYKFNDIGTYKNYMRMNPYVGHIIFKLYTYKEAIKTLK